MDSRYLDLDANECGARPPFAQGLGMTSSSGPHLSLWRQKLGVVPDQVWDRTGLRTLVLADNDLTEVSERVGELQDLRMLDLGHNKLRRLPDSWGLSKG
jgi:Leucine-rich repeat (LRR) protein